MASDRSEYQMPLLVEAKRALFHMLTYQPNLVFFHPTEKMWLEFLPELVAEGYLDPGEVGHLPVFYITPKAQREHYEQASKRP